MPHLRMTLLTLLLGLAAPTWAWSQQPSQPVTDSVINLGVGSFAMTVIAGLMLAFAFQTLLTQLSIALGISKLDSSLFGPKRDQAKDEAPRDGDKSDEAPSARYSSRFILMLLTHAVGIWTVSTASLSLFFATLLAVKLSMVPNVSIGLTLGLVIWAGFFSLMLYIEVQSTISIAGSTWSLAVQGIKGSFKLATSAFSSNDEPSWEEKLTMGTEAIRRDILTELQANNIDDTLKEYIDQHFAQKQPKQPPATPLFTTPENTNEQLKIQEIDNRQQEVEQKYEIKLNNSKSSTAALISLGKTVFEKYQEQAQRPTTNKQVKAKDDEANDTPKVLPRAADVLNTGELAVVLEKVEEEAQEEEELEAFITDANDATLARLSTTKKTKATEKPKKTEEAEENEESEKNEEVEEVEEIEETKETKEAKKAEETEEPRELRDEEYEEVLTAIEEEELIEEEAAVWVKEADEVIQEMVEEELIEDEVEAFLLSADEKTLLALKVVEESIAEEREAEAENAEAEDDEGTVPIGELAQEKVQGWKETAIEKVGDVVQGEGLSVEQLEKGGTKALKKLKKGGTKVIEKAKEGVEVVKEKVQGSIDNIDFPEVDLVKIKEDFVGIFQNPGASLKALKRRLERYDREKFIELLTANDKIDREDIERIADRIIEAKLEAIRKAEEVEQAVAEQWNELQDLAYKQAKQASEATVAATWWLFATAVAAGVCAALGGVLAL